jgi:hypothetical protein
MKRAVVRLRGVGMFLGIGLFAWGVGHPAPAWSDNSCSLSTLKGTHLFECHGVQGKKQADFAFAGKEQFHGDGTLKGVSTYTDKDNVLHRVSYTGTYTVNPDCTGTYTSTDENGVVTHIDMFFGTDAAELYFILTDPGVVDALVERRVGN